MIRWLIYLPFSLLLTVICYITNPIVLLFCDEDGELPSFLHLWQTWDNSCNPSDIKDIAPGWLQYDWDRHYREFIDTDEYLKSVNRSRWYTVCTDYHFTFTEKIKRYICRCIWLTRNNAYGFCFYLLGLNVSPNLEIRQSENTLFIREIFSDGLWGAWSYKNTAPIFKAFGYIVHWNNYLGWKIVETAKLDTRAMIANRIAFYFEKEGE